MSSCSASKAEEILEAINEYFFLKKLDGFDIDTFDLSDMEKYIESETGINGFKFNNYLNKGLNEEDVNEIFNDVFLDDVSTYVDTSNRDVITKSNVSRDFSTNTIIDMFSGLPLAKVYFEGSINGKIVKEIFIGDASSDTYVSDSATLTANLNRLKERLYKDIQTFLMEEGILPKGELASLYDKDGQVADYSHYKAVIDKLGDYFFRSQKFTLLTLNNKKQIPNLIMDLNKDSRIYDAYNNGILLTNFDSVLNEYFPNLVDINFNLFNNLSSNIGDKDKYALRVKGITTTYWKSDDHASEGSENTESQLTKLIISTIPRFNKKNEKTTEYLDMKDFYLFAAQLSNFELLHGNKLRNTKGSTFNYFNKNSKESLDWYLNEIIKAINNEPGSVTELKEHFESNVSFVISLKNYLESPDFNISVKEQNSSMSLVNLFTQAINNNYGASYNKYDASGKYTTQEMYKQNFNNTQVHSSVYTKMARNSTDLGRYNIISNEKEKTRFENLFKDILDLDDAKTIDSGNKKKIARYITDKIGISLHIEAFDDMIEDLRKNSNQPVLSVVQLKNSLLHLMNALDTDFRSKELQEIFETAKTTSTDTTIGEYLPATLGNKAFIAIRNAYLMNYPLRAVMNIETLTGEKLPTFKMANLTYKDTELFEVQRQFENQAPKENLFKSLLIGDQSVILGTGTKLEASNNKLNKSASKFSVSESYISDFQYDFLKNILKNNAFSIVLGNYSDKNTILTKIINAKHKIGESLAIEKSVRDIQEEVRSRGYNYYHDTLYKVFSDYKKLCDFIGLKNNIKLDNFDSNFDKNINEINTILKTRGVRSLLSEYTKKWGSFDNFSLVEELHFSKYEKITSLNQTLIDNYRIFSDSRENGLFYGKGKFIDRQEKNLINKHKKFNKALPNGNTELNLVGFSEDELKELFKKLNLPELIGNKEATSLYVNGKLNPILQKWQWLNALYRNEYLFISAKGEYMHPHKLNKIKGALPYRGDSTKVDFDQYDKEVSYRLSSMAKRNVMFTASIEAPVRNSKLGVPEKINMSVIDDTAAYLYVPNGQVKDNQDAFDGSSFMEYTYSLMLDNSFPGKGYEGTKKQFGTLVSPNSVTIKKDAESVITNDKILKSMNSKIRFIDKKKQMLGLPVGKVAMNFDENLGGQFYYNHLGDIYGIEDLKIVGNTYTMSVSKNGVYQSKPITGEFETLYDLWKLFGGQYSTDEKGNFNEGSNELLYKIITTPDNNKDYPLKNKMIHVISNLSAVKAGGTNVNSEEYWHISDRLAYTSYDSRFMGPQLDAGHEVDASEIKEVTQVISALAQNGNTAAYAREAYNDIAIVIKKSAEPYLKYMKPGEAVNKDELYKYLSDKFISTVLKTKGDDVAKTLVLTFTEDNRIPFSSPIFYGAFVKDVITRMNNEFITRYYSGTGAILIPSHGVIQLYDVPNPDGTFRIATQDDLAKEALKNYDHIAGFSTNEDIVNDYIKNLLVDQDTTWDKIQIGDSIRIPLSEKEMTEITNYVMELDYLTKEQFDYIQQMEINRRSVISLSTPDLYYKYKYANQDLKTPVKRVLNIPRDLKPSLHVFDVNGVTKNTFDLDSIRIRYELNQNIVSEETQNFINQLAIKFNVDPNNKNAVANLINKWSQRELHLLDDKIALNPISIYRNEDGSYRLNEYFGDDNLSADIYEDVKPHYISNNSIPISNYRFQNAELILGDMYKSNFGKDFNDSAYEIESMGSLYFSDKIKKYFDPDDTKADIKLTVSTSEEPIYIKYVTELPGWDKSINIKKDVHAGIDGKTEVTYTRYNQKGDVVYTIPDIENTRVIKEDGKEIILIKAATEINGVLTQVKGYEGNLDKLIKSFKGSIVSYMPLMNGDINKPIEYTKIDRETNTSRTVKTHVNLTTMRQFQKVTGFVRTDRELLKKDWMSKHKDEVLADLSNKKYASWQKSREFIAARIPSQSMQSFMPMKNVAYYKTEKNDAFVSIWQIFLQGSDFDIDKAYVLGSGFNSNGQFDNWSNISNYSTKEQLDELEKLPIPNGSVTEWGVGGADITQELINIANVLNSMEDPIELEKLSSLEDLDYENVDNLSELPASVIANLNSAIRKANASGNKVVVSGLQTLTMGEGTLPIADQSISQWSEWVIKMINKHNGYTGYLHSNNAVKNSIISRIKQIISAPSNQLIANIPVDVEDLRTAADKAIAKAAQGKIKTEDILNHLGVITKNYDKKWKDDPTKSNKATSFALKEKPNEVFELVQDLEKGYYSIHFKTSNKDALTKEEKQTLVKAIAAYIPIGSKLSTYGEISKGAIPGINRFLQEGFEDSGESRTLKFKQTYEPVEVPILIKTKEPQTGIIAKEELLSPYDLFSYYKQQRDASVGKDDVGIAANGLKNLFALTTYYNDYYQNSLRGNDLILNTDNLNKIKFDNKTFKKEFKFATRNEKGENVIKTYDLATIADVQINRAQKELLGKSLGNFSVLRTESAVALSGFTSAATDNAKELIMAKVNANVELASMHIYLMTMGLTYDEIADIMTCDVVSDVIDKLETNIFFTDKSPNVAVILNKMMEQYKGLDDSDQRKINTKLISSIYESAQEIKLLSSILGANQRTSANIEEINKFLGKFEKAIFARENSIFKKNLGLLADINILEQASLEAQKTKITQNWDTILNAIFENNKVLNRASKTDVEHVKNIIREASNIVVGYTDEYGQRRTKTVSLVGGNFDFRYYVDKDNKEYRRIAKNYYNLIKSTFNIFDVIEQVPHYREMVDGIILSHNMLINSSIRYNFAFSKLKDVVKENSWRIRLEDNPTVKNMMGSKSLSVPIGKTEIRKGSTGIDMMVKNLWFKSKGTEDLTFNVNELLKLSGIKSINLYTSDEARSKVDGNTVTVSQDDTTPTIIRLDTNYGMANFKKLTEEVLLPILQKGENNPLLSSLKVETVTNILGLRGTAITSTHSLRNLNNAVSAKKFQELVVAFNNIDIKSEVAGKLKNSEGKTLKWGDVLYAYNLLVSDDKYGNKNLTPLFEYYRKDKSSLAADYVNFFRQVDSGQIPLFDYKRSLEIDPKYIEGDEKEKSRLEAKAKQELDNDILFYTFANKGLLYVKSNDSSDGKNKLEVTNPDFVVVTSITETAKQKLRNQELNDVLRSILTEGFIVKFKC